MSAGPPDPLTVLREYLPGPLESYYLGIIIGAIILPIIVTMFYVTNEVREIIKDKPYYGAIRTHVNNTYNMMLFVLVCTLVNMLYMTRKGEERSDSKNIGFWYTLTFFPMFGLLGARLTTSISFLVLSYSNDLMYLEPSEVVYVKQKLSYLTSGILITFILCLFTWILINANDIIDFGMELVNQGENLSSK
jgi:hypothetical protein